MSLISMTNWNEARHASSRNPCQAKGISIVTYLKGYVMLVDHVMVMERCCICHPDFGMFPEQGARMKLSIEKTLLWCVFQ